MQLMNIEWKWNIPNLLSLLRILLVPVFVILYLLSSDERMDLMYWSFGVLILSGVTDSRHHRPQVQSDYRPGQAARPGGR